MKILRPAVSAAVRPRAILDGPDADADADAGTAQGLELDPMPDDDDHDDGDGDDEGSDAPGRPKTSRARPTAGQRRRYMYLCPGRLLVFTRRWQRRPPLRESVAQHPTWTSTTNRRVCALGSGPSFLFAKWGGGGGGGGSRFGYHGGGESMRT